LDRPIFVQGDFVEEPQGAGGLQDGTGRQFAFVGQVQLIGADLLGAEGVRGLPAMAGEQRDLLDVSGPIMR
jgi:hypothetical protein